MEIKALWGFINDKGQVKAGETVTVAAEEGHALIGKGLAVAAVKTEEAPADRAPVTEQQHDKVPPIAEAKEEEVPAAPAEQVADEAAEDKKPKNTKQAAPKENK